MNPEEWMQHGACVGEDPDLFFPSEGGPATKAKAICAVCPVRVECLTFAVSEPISFGIWGGLTPRERRRVRRRRFDMLDRAPTGERHLAMVEDT